MPASIDSGAPSKSDPLKYAFAPVHKAALGVAVALVSGSLVFLVTAFHVIAQPASAPNLNLLSQYFYGYEVSWRGAFIGFFWSSITGFVSGWFMAFVRNLVVSISVFVINARAQITRTADFLDQI